MKLQTTLSLPFILGNLMILQIMGCSYHYDQGKKLEAQERWEEAAIEYRLAVIEDPDDEDFVQALARVAPEAAKDQLIRYQEYLQQREYQKAYKRLVNASVLDPDNEQIQKELGHWTKVLVAGKVDFVFDRIQANIRLADSMDFQVWINTPNGRILKTSISNESGYFFAEDLLYRQGLERLALYSLHLVGLELTYKDSSNYRKQQLQRMVQFRALAPSSLTGALTENSDSEEQDILQHRSQLFSTTTPLIWFPPRRIQYSLTLEGDTIYVQSSVNRMDFLPQALYWNEPQQRAFVDFGSNEVRLDSQTQRWGMLRRTFSNQDQDYFTEFSRNLALYPYFLYREGAYHYQLQ